MSDEKYEQMIRMPRVNNWVRARLEDRQRDNPTYRSVEHEVALWVEATERAWSEVYAQLTAYWKKDREAYTPAALLTEFNRILDRVQRSDERPEHISAQDIIDRLDDLMHRGLR